MTIKEIIEGCRLSGVNLEQRLAAVEYSTIPAQAEEAELIKAELRRRKERRAPS